MAAHGPQGNAKRARRCAQAAAAKKGRSRVRGAVRPTRRSRRKFLSGALGNCAIVTETANVRRAHILTAQVHGAQGLLAQILVTRNPGIHVIARKPVVGGETSSRGVSPRGAAGRELSLRQLSAAGCLPGGSSEMILRNKARISPGGLWTLLQAASSNLPRSRRPRPERVPRIPANLNESYMSTAWRTGGKQQSRASRPQIVAPSAHPGYARHPRRREPAGSAPWDRRPRCADPSTCGERLPTVASTV